MIPMRDGVRLAADLDLPARNGAALAGKYPTISGAHARRQDGPRRPARRSLSRAQHGYAILLNDTRGPVRLREQVNALGPQGVALVETLKVIGEKGVRITPDVMASGAGEGAGGLGTLLLFVTPAASFFRSTPVFA